MGDKRRFEGGYRLFTRLLARKGSAEPLPVQGERLILARGNDVEPDGGERLAGAVFESTLEVIADDARERSASKAAARLTDLLDPALVDVVRHRR